MRNTLHQGYVHSPFTLADRFTNKYQDAFYYEDPETGRRKRKKKKKYVIDGVSPEDLAVLDEVRSRAWALEMCLMRCCGFNIGWVAVLGLIPM